MFFLKNTKIISERTFLFLDILIRFIV